MNWLSLEFREETLSLLAYENETLQEGDVIYGFVSIQNILMKLRMKIGSGKWGRRKDVPELGMFNVLSH
jgi:hypothetical protein